MYCIAVNDPSGISVVEIPQSTVPASAGPCNYISITDYCPLPFTNWPSVINQAINDMSALGGGIIHFPAGVYLLPSAVKLKSNVILQGAGFGRTRFIADVATSHNVVETDGFAALVGTNTTGGPRGFGLRDLTIDGNRWNRTGTGVCLAIYGYDYELTNVEIYDARGIGFYSEWAISGNVPVTPNGR